MRCLAIELVNGSPGTNKLTLPNLFTRIKGFSRSGRWGNDSSEELGKVKVKSIISREVDCYKCCVVAGRDV
jgi:hypothetical protein